MDDRHISAAMARAFFRSEVSPEDRLFFIRHLLSDCRSCRDLVMQIAKAEGATLPLDEDRTTPEIPDSSFEIAILKIVGLAQWSLFEGISPEKRDALLDSDPSFCHFGFYDRLLEAALYAARDDPREGEDIALLALKVATKIAGVSTTLREDLIAGAYAVLGNTIRQRGDYDLAAETFTQAWSHIEEGTGDLLVTARVQQYEASWLNDLGRFEEAETILQTVADIYRELGDTHREGRTLVKMGVVRMNYNPAGALKLFILAETLYDPAEEPYLEWCVRHNLAWCLNDCGQPRDALAMLEASRGLYRKFDNSYVRLRGSWLEGRIAFGFERYSEAVQIFKLLWAQMRAEDNPIDLTLVSVDLAQSLAFAGEVEESIGLIQDLIPILKGLGLHSEGVAVWLLTSQKLKEGVATNPLLWELMRDYFKKNFRVPVHFSDEGHL